MSLDVSDGTVFVLAVTSVECMSATTGRLLAATAPRFAAARARRDRPLGHDDVRDHRLGTWPAHNPSRVRCCGRRLNHRGNDELARR